MWCVEKLRGLMDKQTQRDAFTIFNSVLNHPNSAAVVSIPGQGYFRLDKQCHITGVTGLIGTPVYEPEASILKNNKSSCALTGIEHGSLVHSQMELVVGLIHGHITLPYILSKYPHIGIDSCIIHILNTLVLKCLFPVYSELLVYDPLSNYGTSIDLICYYCPPRSNGGFVAVELKTGYDNKEYDSKKVPMLPHPFSELGTHDSFCSRHQIQLVAGMLLSELSYGFPFKYGLIIRACPKARCAQTHSLTINVLLCKQILFKLMRNAKITKDSDI